VPRSDTLLVFFCVALITILGLAVIAVPRLTSPASDGNGPPPPPPHPPPPPPDPSECRRSVGLCTELTVTRVIDGDTLEVEGGLRIRLVLVDAPELSEPAGPASRDYLKTLCLGSRALIDEDDSQIGEDPYGRVLAVVTCGGTNANAALISSGNADTYYTYCDDSEFGGEAWTGCSSPPPPGNCDPAYPSVCIPSPPPDLDCAEISLRNFQVLAPDPHHFDGDLDGVGCEG